MRFPTLPEVLSIHQIIVAETGGQPGLRDRGLLESALKAAENRHYYEQADAIDCAATYAYHLCMAHAFIDGNKRVAAAVSETVLCCERPSKICFGVVPLGREGSAHASSG